MMKKLIVHILFLLTIIGIFSGCSYRESCGYHGPYYECGYRCGTGCNSCGPYRTIW